MTVSADSTTTDTTFDFGKLTDARPVRKKIPRPIPYEELQSIASEAMNLSREIAILEEEKKEVDKDFNGRINSRQKRMSNLVSIWDSKKRDEEVDGIIAFDWEDKSPIVFIDPKGVERSVPCPFGKKWFVSHIDGQIFGPEAATEEDRQAVLGQKNTAGEWVIPQPLMIEGGERSEIIVAVDRVSDDDVDVTAVEIRRGDEVLANKSFEHGTSDADVMEYVIETLTEIRTWAEFRRPAVILSCSDEFVKTAQDFLQALYADDDTSEKIAAVEMLRPDAIVEAEIVEDTPAAN